MGKGPKCETNQLPRGFNVARLLSRAVALKNMFFAFCVFPVGLASYSPSETWCVSNMVQRRHLQHPQHRHPRCTKALAILTRQGL